MHIWPNDFPAQCPPADAMQLSGIVFRFINGRSPTEKDFWSHYERNPVGDWSRNPCIARGLSVVRTTEDCGIMREGIPALRKKEIAVANIDTQVGPIANTPSGNCLGHFTWWRAVPAVEVVALFSKLDSKSGDGNV